MSDTLASLVERLDSAAQNIGQEFPATADLILEAAAELSDQRVLRCAFCDAEYPPDTPPTQHDALAAHIKVCPKHPMRDLEAIVADSLEWFDKLSRLGNAPYLGNSDGNVMAQKAMTEIAASTRAAAESPAQGVGV